MIFYSQRWQSKIARKCIFRAINMYFLWKNALGVNISLKHGVVQARQPSGLSFFGERHISFRVPVLEQNCTRWDFSTAEEKDALVSLLLCQSVETVEGERLKRQDRQSVCECVHANVYVCFCIHAYLDAHAHSLAHAESYRELSWKLLCNQRLPRSSPLTCLLLFLPPTTLVYF